MHSQRTAIESIISIDLRFNVINAECIGSHERMGTIHTIRTIPFRWLSTARLLSTFGMGVCMYATSFAFAFSEYFFGMWCSAGDNDNGIYVDYLRGLNCSFSTMSFVLAPAHAHLFSSV